MTSGYRVLARKYRPTILQDLIGQETLVRILHNSFQSGRIAHAFMLTGVRGVGKTTTARIIARSLNCIGSDGLGGVTTKPCGTCTHCSMISQDRHVDVLEIDAASRTGVGDMREIIDSVKYLPVSARYKIYIIDEIHMLSTSAFNALLKTLEEPPPHVKFIFATTEIRKVPVTVLSRCQRFDLSRIDTAILTKHLLNIAAQEAISLEQQAAILLAEAADGSARDSLSLLDQAIVMANGPITAPIVQEMLGHGQDQQILVLFEYLIDGKIALAIQELEQFYRQGVDPSFLFQDLLRFTHQFTLLKQGIKSNLTWLGVDLENLPDSYRQLLDKLQLDGLNIMWQILLKGLNEVQTAFAPLQAAQMVFIRLTHYLAMPGPGEISQLFLPNQPVPTLGQPTQNNAVLPTKASPGNTTIKTANPSPTSSTVTSAALLGEGKPTTHSLPSSPVGSATLKKQLEPVNKLTTQALEQNAAASSPPTLQLHSFEEVLRLVDERRQGLLHAHLMRDLRLITFVPGFIECGLTPDAPPNLTLKLGQFLRETTGMRWEIKVNRENAHAPTTLEQQRMLKVKQEQAALQQPIMQNILKHFPESKIERIYQKTKDFDILSTDSDTIGLTSNVEEMNE